MTRAEKLRAAEETFCTKPLGAPFWASGACRLGGPPGQFPPSVWCFKRAGSWGSSRATHVVHVASQPPLRDLNVTASSWMLRRGNTTALPCGHVLRRSPFPGPGMFADGCLACRNPGEHLKLEGLHGAGWVVGGSAFVSSFRPRSRHPEISPGFQPGFHLSSSSLRQCVAGCEAPKECVETEDEVAGCCCWWHSGEYRWWGVYTGREGP